MSPKSKIAIGVALLFHVSGFIGMLTNAKPWFVSMTPMTLLLMFGLFVWTEENKSRAFFQYAIIAFCVGMIVEIIGVNTALLFGSYEYGTVMGPRLFGVPILMGIQWLMTIWCSSHLLRYLLKFTTQKISPLLFAAAAALITTSFDVAIEPVAMDFDYWNWENDVIPFYNYVCWFMVSLGLHWINERYYKQSSINILGVFLFGIQVIFFVLLHLFL
jgi:bisanhydrobacterioruberin hydratase